MQRHLVLSVAAVALSFLLAGSALAGGLGPSSCANVTISSSFKCETMIEGGCEAQCTPVHFELSCDAQCKTSCNETAETVCVDTCQTKCNTECELDAGSFDCGGYCSVNCGADCEASCSGHVNEANCRANCTASCNGDCQVGCDVVLPSATCETRCQKSCGTSCTTIKNVQCRTSCHGACTTNLTGGCKIRCTEPKGALFCDGQFINASSVQDCIDYLLTQSIKVNFAASVTGAISCNKSNAPDFTAAGLLFLALMALGFRVTRQRREENI